MPQRTPPQPAAASLRHDGDVRILRSLYRGLDGFSISRADGRRVRTSRGSATYGELQPTATLRLLASLALTPDDVFVDLGAGIGKVALAAAMYTPVGHARGVELSEERVSLANIARQRAVDARRVDPRRYSVRCDDICTAAVNDVTVAYTCSTAFSTRFLMRLASHVATAPRIRCFLTFRDLDPHPAWRLDHVVRLDVSWKRRQALHMYRPTRTCP